MAVYHAEDGSLPIVAPCGMCREMIADCNPSARVIVPGDDAAATIASIEQLIPGRFALLR